VGRTEVDPGVDLTIFTGFGGEERYIDDLLDRFAPRREDARQFAIRYRVVLLETGTVPVDVALGAMPFEERAVGRATAWPLADGTSIRTCSAEDLVVFKAFAGRDQDWLDITGVHRRQKARLDTALILDEVAPLLDLKGAPDDLGRLQQLLAT